MGLIAGAMSGFGEAAGHVGRQLGEHTSRSILQQELAAIARARDERLDELRRAPGMAAAADIEAARTGVVDDLSGTARPRTPAEMAEVEEGAYRKQGLVQEAMQVRSLEQQRGRDTDARLGRARDDERADEQLQISRDTFDINAKGANLERQIKELALANAQRVEKLRTEFASASPEHKLQITEEVQLLTGKDNDQYLPVPIKDETGAITGYQIFDKRRGVWVEASPGAGGKSPTAADIEGLVQRAKDPKALEFFESKFGKGSAARFLQQKPAADSGKPKLPGDRIVDADADRELKARTNFGRLTSDADLARAVEMGNQHALKELERRKGRAKDSKRPVENIPYQAP